MPCQHWTSSAIVLLQVSHVDRTRKFAPKGNRHSAGFIPLCMKRLTIYTQTMELTLHHFNQCQHSSYYVGLNQSPQPHQLGRLLACFMPCLRFLKNFSKRMNKNLPLQITQNKKPQKQQWPKKKPTNREFLISLLQQLSLYILHTKHFFFPFAISFAIMPFPQKRSNYIANCS